jgi:hypothetical protein
MSDDKQTKEVKDDELDKVSGGTGEHSMGTGAHPEDRLGHHHADSAGHKKNEFGAGGKQFTK